MVAPTFKKATDTAPGNAAQYGAPDLKYALDVLDGTHPTDKIQVSALEGLKQSHNYILYKSGTKVAALKSTGEEVATGVAGVDDNSVMAVVFGLVDAANPGTVVVKPGTYLSAVPRPTLNSGTTVVGIGNPTFKSTVNLESPMQTVLGAQNIKVIGCTFDCDYIGHAFVARGDNVNGATKNILIQDCTFKNMVDQTLAGGSGNWLLTTTHSDWHAPTERNENTRVINCHFDSGTERQAIDLKEAYLMSTTHHGLVQGCTFTNLSPTKNASLTFYQNNLDCAAIGNTFWNNANGLDIWGHDINITQSTNIRVVGNQCENQIRIADARHVVISGNIVRQVRIWDIDKELHDDDPSIYRGSKHILISGNTMNADPTTTGASSLSAATVDAAVYFQLQSAKLNPPSYISIIGNQVRTWKNFVKFVNANNAGDMTAPVEKIFIGYNHVTVRTLNTGAGRGPIDIQGDPAVPNDGFKDIWIIGNVFPVTGEGVNDIYLSSTNFSNIIVRDNVFGNNGVFNASSYPGVSGNNYGLNSGNRLTNSGTATIPSGSTSVVVTHGCAFTPTAVDVVVTGTNNPTVDPGHVWTSTYTSTQFTINCKTNPSTSGATFAWVVWKRS